MDDKTWPRLRGPTGIRVGCGWVQAFFLGLPLAGMPYGEAKKYPDSGRAWLVEHIRQHWGQQVVDRVLLGGVETYE